MEKVTLLLRQAREGSQTALSEILNMIENGFNKSGLYRKLYRFTKQIYSVALMGPAGVGKSSLLAQLILNFTRYQHIGVIAIDPRSFRSGGAFLGDRLRMAHRTHHPRIFFRSFAPQRAPFSGLITASLMARAFEAAGYGLVMIETPGTGQSEWSLESVADSRVLLLSPESGDEFQMMKRGLLESADIFVINKCDRPGARALESALQREIYDSRHLGGQWKRPILLTNAVTGEGADALFEMIEKHQQYLIKSAELENRRRVSFNSECLVWAMTMIWQKAHEMADSLRSQNAQNAYEEGKRIIKEVTRG